MRYAVFVDTEGQFIDVRKKQFSISFKSDPNQVQTVFQLNTLIKNELFSVGDNRERKFYHTLKLELQDLKDLDEEFTLEFSIEKFKIEL